MKLIKKWKKRAEIQKNRIIIPKVIVEKFGREFYLEWYEDDIIRIVPVKDNTENK